MEKLRVGVGRRSSEQVHLSLRSSRLPSAGLNKWFYALSSSPRKLSNIQYRKRVEDPGAIQRDKSLCVLLVMSHRSLQSDEKHPFLLACLSVLERWRCQYRASFICCNRFFANGFPPRLSPRAWYASFPSRVSHSSF